jgi:K+-sensing histidine kinase KdpD
VTRMKQQDRPAHDRAINELLALTKVAAALASPKELPDLLGVVMQTITKALTQADIGTIMLWDESSSCFRPIISHGLIPGVLDEIELHAGESITGKVFNQGQACLFSTVEEVSHAMSDMDPHSRQVMIRAAGTDEIPQCVIAAPISAAGQKFGVLILESIQTDNPFTEQDIPFVQTLADLIALVVERSRLETMNEANREAQQAERMRTEVLGTLSHELRLPLATIRGYATALLLEEVTWSEDKKMDFLRQIENACDDMDGMLKGILDSSLIDIDQLVMEYQPIRLQHVANEIASEIEHRSPIHHPVVDIPADFPIIEADLRWIKQVYRNVIDNAIKYSPNGGLIVIRGEVREHDVVISVSDQGVGISPEHLIPLFEKYFRIRSAATLHISGTGLGLPIARAIVEAHGGHIWVDSRIGEGTTISFSLPLNKQATGPQRKST